MGLLFGLLLVLAALRPLAVPDEGRYAEIGRWMLHSGDWLIPRLNGIPFFHKPAYLYWMEAAFMGLLGVHTWVARLVPAVHAGLMLVALYLSARAMTPGPEGERLARRAVWMLGSSLAFLLGGQYVNHDMAVAAWIGVAIWLLAWSFMRSEGDRPHAGLARWGAVACAFGVLSKGLIGLVLPGLVLFVWLIWTRQWRKVLRLPWLTGLALLVLIAVPWFVMAEHHTPGLLAYLFGNQQFNRYVATTFNNARPWWFYLAGVFVLLFPWGFLALPKLWALARRQALRLGDAPHAWTALAVVWLVCILGFFSVPNSKLIGYALPVMPPLALLAAQGYGRWMEGSRLERPVFGALLMVALATAGAANWAGSTYTHRHGAQDVAQVLACRWRPADTVFVVDDYPYDVPFLAQLPQPMTVVLDWAAERRSARDNWRRELFEGADFDAGAARALQGPEVLAAAASLPGQWVVAPRQNTLSGWPLVYEGRAWSLYLSPATDAQRAAAAPGTVLPGCPRQGQADPARP